jgi:hypothetical protein
MCNISLVLSVIESNSMFGACHALSEVRNQQTRESRPSTFQQVTSKAGKENRFLFQ